MYSNLNCYKKTSIYRLLYLNFIVATKKESKHNAKASYKTTREERNYENSHKNN